MAATPYPFAILPERVGAIIVSDITTGADFNAVSAWIYEGLAGGQFTYGHLEVLLEELKATVSPSVLADVRNQGLGVSAADGGASVGWVDAGRRFSADLSLTKVAAELSVEVGGTVTWVITLIYAGPQTTDRVVVSDRLPECVEFVRSEASRGSYEPSTGEWAVGKMAVGDSVSLAISATVGADCSISFENEARITASSLPDPDPRPIFPNLPEDVPAPDDIASATVDVMTD